MCKENLKEILEYVNIQTGEKLDLEKTNYSKGNAILRINPNLWEIWDFEKNNRLGFDIWKMTKGSEKKVWWYCNKCRDSYPQEVKMKMKGNGCSICSGDYATSVNSLASLNPLLASQWHPTLNGDLTPYNVTCGSSKKVWWICELGHEWKTTINDRSTKNCPYCSNRRLLKGFNDIWTTNPELAKLILNPDDGYKYTQGSKKKLDWKCQSCGEIIRKRAIYSVGSRGLPCPKCKDGKSYSEKFMHSLLNQLDVHYNDEHTFKWSDGKRYDFYVESLSLVIEVHGAQHYEKTGRNKARSLNYEQENDKYKYELAVKNGIEKYVVIDCRRNNLVFIKNSILNSELNIIFPLNKVDWTICHRYTYESVVKLTCETWNKGVKSTVEISRILNMNLSTVIRYLKIGHSLGLCNYIPKENVEYGAEIGAKKRWKKVICITTGEIFDSIKEASNYIRMKPENISKHLSGRQKSAGKHAITGEKLIWAFYEDYKESQNKIS